MSSPHSGIQGLADLARRDRVELRPVLLRVLTDLYVQEGTHGPAERARYSELACRFLDSVDLATRAVVAERLAGYPNTPPAVAGKLARDDISVANPVLRRSTALSEAELHSILDHCGIAHAIAIGSREDLPPSIAERLRETGLRRSTPAAAKPPAAPESSPALTYTLARRFLVTHSEERRLILTALACCPSVDREERLRHIGGGLNARLEQAALQHRTREFAAILQQQAGMPRDITERIIGEATGEPLAVICRAFGMPFSAASRILLFLNPVIGGSAGRMSGSAETYKALRLTDTRRLVAAWCGLGADLRAPAAVWTRRAGERNDPRPAPQRSIRYVTPVRPAAASES